VPLPIQVGSVTDRLRRFFRIRGRSSFQLDEIVVPVTMIQDLSKGPYQAGVSPASGHDTLASGIGNQLAILINPNQTLPIQANLANDINFIGRSFTITGLQVAGQDGSNIRCRVGLVPRANVTAANVSTIQGVNKTQDTPGFPPVPVVIVGVVAIAFIIFPAVQETWQMGQVPREPLSMIIPPQGITIRSTEALVLETPVASGVLDVNVVGFYQEQPN